MSIKGINFHFKRVGNVFCTIFHRKGTISSEDQELEKTTLYLHEPPQN